MGKVSRILMASVAAATLAVPASAAVLFELSGLDNATWQLPTSPTPDGFVSFGFQIDNVNMMYEGSPILASVVFYNETFNGGVCGSSDGLVCDLFIGIGPTLFSGTLEAPTFLTGTYGLVPGYRLTISNAPEPASWAMLIAGFGLVGAAARRRRKLLAA